MDDPMIREDASPDLASNYRVSAMVSIYQVLAFTAALFPQRPAVSDHARSLTYSSFKRRVEAFAAVLEGRYGVRRGSRVAVQLPKTSDQLCLLLGCNALGAVAVPINPKLKVDQVRHIEHDCRPEVLVATARRLEEFRAASDSWGTAFCALESLVKQVDESDGGPANLANVVDGDPALILYTSGSTGLPKGIVLSQRNVVAGAFSVASYLQLRPDDVVLGLLPISFDAGFSQVTTALASGAHYVAHEFVSASLVPRVCLSHGVTVITAVPPLWHLLVGAAWGEAEASRIRLAASTGGHVDAGLLACIQHAFPRAVPFLMYGLTEAFRSTFLDPAALAARASSIGKAVPNAEIAVVDPDGNRCAAGEEGELVHRGGFVTLGYLNVPEANAQRFRPWPCPGADTERVEMAVWSGDIVRMDDDGFIYYVGRRDEMIKTSGHRVSPGEIENVLMAYPGVGRAAAFGVPDRILGQHIIAAIEWSSAEGDTDSLMRHCKSVLPGYMVPRAIHPVSELPMNPNGKIDRNLLRQWLGASGKDGHEGRRLAVGGHHA